MFFGVPTWLDTNQTRLARGIELVVRILKMLDFIIKNSMLFLLKKCEKQKLSSKKCEKQNCICS